MDRQSFNALIEAAIAHQRDGRLNDALHAYQRALEIRPEHPVVLHNLGALSASSGDLKIAISYFDRAIATEPRYSSAHYNRAMALQSLGDLAGAARSLATACRIEPAFYEGHRALGFLWLALGQRDRALDHFAHTYDLRRGENQIGIARESLKSASRQKLRHDAEQFAYLARRGRDGSRFMQKMRAYEQLAGELLSERSPLSDNHLEMIGEDYNTLIFTSSAPEIQGPAVAPRPDHADIARAYNQQGGMAIIDGLLTATGLASLRRFLLETTLWHDFRHIDDFVASYLEDGLACPLVLQIADEMRARFPELLGDLKLTQAWAFKALTMQASVGAHADDAEISVNFWVTPDSANLRPGSGGLAVCLAQRPEAVSIRDYQHDESKAAAFMDMHQEETRNVPYGENRAVIFKSDLLHRSDAPYFAAGYENMRINVTMLFGRR